MMTFYYLEDIRSCVLTENCQNHNAKSAVRRLLVKSFIKMSQTIVLEELGQKTN